jgi:ABC-2 type transport system ATP-binding protein
MPAIVADGLTKVFRTYKKKPGLGGAVRGLFRREYEDMRAATMFPSDRRRRVRGFPWAPTARQTTVLKMLSGLLHPTSGPRASSGIFRGAARMR